MHKLEDIINYKFKNKDLLIEALTHPSYKLENENAKDYERLEFLGDSLLGFIIAEMLSKTYSKDNEGSLAKKKSKLVSGPVLSKIASSLKLGQYMKFSKSEINTGGIENKRNLENALEALIAAIYLDSNIENCRNFIRDNWNKMINDLDLAPQDPKTALQEYLQKTFKSLPKYVLLSQTGPAHDPIFEVGLEINGKICEKSSGKSKKLAEAKVASIYLNHVNQN